MNQLSLLHRALHLPRPSPRRGHGFTAAAAAAAVIRARLSSPDPAPQQHPVRLAITAPHQESVKASVTTCMESNNNVAPREAAADGDGRTCELPTWALIGGMTAGVAAALLLSAGAGPAQALGPPEGPLVEEFWDNMRRYALYVVTVSTGVAYTVLQPIVELLKNPVTALLIVAVLAGSGFLVSQVLNAMVGNSDFIYRYE